MRAADELIECIVKSSEVPSGRRRAEILRELRAHIEDFVLAAREAGHEAEEIEKLVLAHFGDPSQIAQGFAWVYRQERRRLRALAYTLSTVLLASWLLATILPMQAGLALGFGTPILKVLASKHTVIEALDILASVATYLGMISLERLFERQRFQKAALLLTMICAIGIVPCAAAGMHISFLLFGLVTGILSRAVQLFVSLKAARFAIVVFCFSLAGLFFALLRVPVSPVALGATCANWFVMGAGYQLMTQVAGRFDAALFEGLRRMQAG